MVIVDDLSEENILDVLRKNALDMNWQYVRIDSHRNDFPIFWGPALSNNVGFKTARGEVLVITGPEMLMTEAALELSYRDAMQDKAVYGHILHSSHQFVRLMDQNPNMEEYRFDRLFVLPQSRVQDITAKTFYWFWMACKKSRIMEINGCDEEFMRGICGDDDDFANRICEAGAEKIHNYDIKGIHQDHRAEDRNDPKRTRWDAIWEPARLRNTRYLEEWAQRGREAVANQGRDWGSDKLVIYQESHRR